MQIVIDIDKKFYEIAFSDSNHGIALGALQALRRGIVLPEKHGRLIDADELKKDDEVTEWITRDAARTGKTVKLFSELFIKKIDDAPTIIEATEEWE